MPRSKQTSVKIVNVDAIALDPQKKYLIVFNKGKVTLGAGKHLLQALMDLGVDTVGVGLKDGDKMEIVELPEKGGTDE